MSQEPARGEERIVVRPGSDLSENRRLREMLAGDLRRWIEGKLEDADFTLKFAAILSVYAAIAEVPHHVSVARVEVAEPGEKLPTTRRGPVPLDPSLELEKVHGDASIPNIAAASLRYAGRRGEHVVIHLALNENDLSPEERALWSRAMLPYVMAVASNEADLLRKVRLLVARATRLLGIAPRSEE